MEKTLKIIAVLLARIAGNMTGTDYKTLLMEAETDVSASPGATDSDAVEMVYRAYPGKCPVRGTATGKSARNKEQIKRLLKDHSADDLVFIINRYIDDCTAGQCYIKNFGTFLNQLPDYSDDEGIFQQQRETDSRKPQE